MTGKNRITGYFFTFFVTILILLSFPFSGNAQTFPEGLVGLSSDDPAVLYSIDASTGAATPIVTLNGGASTNGSVVPTGDSLRHGPAQFSWKYVIF